MLLTVPIEWCVTEPHLYLGSDTLSLTLTLSPTRIIRRGPKSTEIAIMK